MGTSALACGDAVPVFEQQIGALKVTALPFGPMAPSGPPWIVGIFSFDQNPDQVFGQSYIEMIHSLLRGEPR